MARTAKAPETRATKTAGLLASIERGIQRNVADLEKLWKEYLQRDSDGAHSDAYRNSLEADIQQTIKSLGEWIRLQKAARRLA
jgi:hypothetical protein